MNIFLLPLGFFQKYIFPSFGKIFLLFVVVSTLYFSSTAFAIDIDKDLCNGGSCLEVGVGKVEDVDAIESEGTLSERIVDIINEALLYLGILLLIVIVYAGFLLVVSNGDDDAITKARKIILYALLGVIIIVLSYAIVNFVATVALGRDAASQVTDNGGNNGNGAGKITEGINTGGNGNNGGIDISDPVDLGNGNGLGDAQNDGDNGVEDEIDGIIDDIDDLKDKLPVQQSEIDDIRERITELYDTVPHTEEVVKKYTEIENLLKQLEADPTDPKVLDAIIKKTEEFKRIVSLFPEVHARIKLFFDRRTVPARVTFSGESTFVRNADSVFPRNEDYKWSILGPDSTERTIGNGLIREYLLEESGRYILSLSVPLKDASGKEVGIEGKRKYAFTIAPRGTEVGFTVNDKTHRETLEFTQDENEAGITFDPALTEVQTGRSIVRYLWDFGGYKVEKNDPTPVRYTFTENGNHSVSLTVTDNTGKSFMKRSSVFVTTAVAYFSLSKSQYEIGDKINFSGKKSKTTRGSIIQYDWKLTSPDGKSDVYSDKEFSFEVLQPGTYTVSLNITDDNGVNAEYSTSFQGVSGTPQANFVFSIPEKTAPAHVFFDATSSDDEYDQLLYSWDFDGDGVYDQVKNETPFADYVYSEAKRFRPVLKVENKYGVENTKEKRVDILSVLTAEIETNGIVFPKDEEISFTAVSNNGTAYEWNFQDGEGRISTDNKNIAHTFTVSGRYSVSLVIYGENGDKNSVTKTIFIGEKDAPIAGFELKKNGRITSLEENLCGSGKDGISIFRSDEIIFSAEPSSNVDGTKRGIEYLWNFPGNVQERKEKLKWKFSTVSQEQNCEEVILSVVDKQSGKKSGAEKIFIQVKNKAPQLYSFSVKPAKQKVSPIAVVLSVKADDKDGKITRYKWWATRIGQASSEKISFHTTTEPKTVLTIGHHGTQGESHSYLFHVELEDNTGDSTLSDDILGDSPELTLITGEDKSPQVSVKMDKTKIKMGDTIVFTAIAKSSGGQDLKDIATFKWDFDGDNRFDVIGPDSVVAYKYMIPGKFAPRLKVVYQGLSTSVVKKVEVERVSKVPLAMFSIQKIGPTKILVSARKSKFDNTVSGNTLQFIWDKDLSTDSDGDGNKKNDVDGNKVEEIFEYEKGTTKVNIGLIIRDLTNGEDEMKRSISFDAISGIVGTVLPGEDAETNTDLLEQISEKLGTLVNESIQISTASPSTTLEVFGGEEQVLQNENVGFLAFIQNADGTPYEGEVSFSVEKGNGVFSPEVQNAVAGKVSTVFTSSVVGPVEIKVSAKETVSGEIHETMNFDIQ